MKTQEADVPRYIKRFFAEYLPMQRNCSPHTISAYNHGFRLFLGYLRDYRQIAPSALTVKELSAANVLDFLNNIQEERRNGPVTRNVRLAAIRAFVKYMLLMEPTLACDLQAILAIPTKRTQQRTLDFLTRDEMEAVLDAPDASTWSGKRDRVLLTVMYNTGARVSEIVGVKMADIALSPGGTLRLHGKGRKERVLPLWSSTLKSVKTWVTGNGLQAGDALFANARGGPMTRSGVEKRLQETVRIASLHCPSLTTKRVSPHTIRHTTAMHLLQSGVDITLIALWLGHESIETTHIYITMDLTMKEQALQALQPPSHGEFRFRATDGLLAFLESL